MMHQRGELIYSKSSPLDEPHAVYPILALFERAWADFGSGNCHGGHPSGEFPGSRLTQPERRVGSAEHFFTIDKGDKALEGL